MPPDTRRTRYLMVLVMISLAGVACGDADSALRHATTVARSQPSPATRVAGSSTAPPDSPTMGASASPTTETLPEGYAIQTAEAAGAWALQLAESRSMTVELVSVELLTIGDMEEAAGGSMPGFSDRNAPIWRVIVEGDPWLFPGSCGRGPYAACPLVAQSTLWLLANQGDLVMESMQPIVPAPTPTLVAELVDASPEEMAQRAVERVLANPGMRGGEPEVLLSRRMTRAEFYGGLREPVHFVPSPTASPEPALPSPEVTDPDAPLHVVILHGDFNQDVLTGRDDGSSMVAVQVTYIAIVWDLRYGWEPISSEISCNGAMFKDLLDDPSLPNEEPHSLGSACT